MTHIKTSVHCNIKNSFRVQQVAGMFDLPVCETIHEDFAVDVPALDDNWQIGAIVGPSGSGKSTIARAAFGDAVYASGDWSPDAAVIDGFGDLPIKQITRMLTAVGFGSPPSWLKPYRVLSTGEQFRCELARALLRGASHQTCPSRSDNKAWASLVTCPTLTVFDEFTSVVDRNVARVASAAVGKAIRRGHVHTRLVVVSCHDDILPWLAPDWVVDMQTQTRTWGCLRRPTIELEIVRAKHAAWRMFAKHHYLSGSLSRGAQVFLAICSDVPVALCAIVGLYGYVGRRRIHRLVTLPDFQGIGIGSRLLDAVAGIEQASGQRVNITTSHPAVIAHCRGSPLWKAVAVRRGCEASRQNKAGKAIRSSRGRTTVSFEYIIV